ncbi:DUF1444 family protein [Planctomicrobium piriforme]|uniref:DUF1444 family protein n=1 Tax=Planctomicrobium piriforme TaxID=1576369 RepID=A0A1I3E695_9PLAN|nr:DUF1444 family protein [Planctomicrobium piriforme]SFH94383.1 Protein of unknown function [Planctomicrobium piriforme]
MAETAPDHWSLLSGPANWFRLRHPPRWQAEDRQGAYALRPPDSEALLAINTIWLSEERDSEERANVLPRLQDVVDQFPRVKNVEAVAEPQVPDAVDCMQGEAVLDLEKTWWGRLLKGDRWRAWKMWAFQRSQLLIVVTLLHAGERDPELESMVRLMLRCLELPEHPADPPEVFAQRAVELSRKKFPLLKVELLSDFQIQIATSRLNLANFYRAYVREPDKFDQILLPAMTTAVQVQGWGEQETAPPLEIVRDRLMPMLYPEQVWRDKFPDILGEPWVAGLVILYVVDESNAYWYVRKELTGKWGLTPQDLHEIAIDNLQSYFERQPMEMAVANSEEGVPAVMMPSKPDTYNTTRLLCHSFLSQLREVAQGDLVMGVPGRDFFVAVSTRLPEMVGRIRARVREDYEQTDHPLTNRMLLVTADGVSELIDDDVQ